jgi:hypothetical protein
MIETIGLLVGAILRLFRSRRGLLLENLALRQQLAALKRRHPRPRLAAFNRLFWVLAQKFCSGWEQALIIVSPETVVRWHRLGFALYWCALSRARRVVAKVEFHFGELFPRVGFVVTNLNLSGDTVL